MDQATLKSVLACAKARLEVPVASASEMVASAAILVRIFISIPLCVIHKKGLGRNHRANPLAIEVSRAFVPPCFRMDVSHPVVALGPDTPRSLQISAGTLAPYSPLTEQATCQV